MPNEIDVSALVPEVTSILDDFRRVVRSLRESSREAEQRLGVSGAQLFVLQKLAAQPELSLNELAGLTRTHQSTVSVVVKRLVEAGLVRRVSALDDGRRIALSLTRKGRSLLARAPLAAQDRLISGLDKLAPATREALAAALHALVAAMELDADLPTMFFEDAGERSQPDAPTGGRHGA